MGPYELLEIVVGVFERIHVPYLVTGALASIAYGEPRLTNDIDIVAEIKESHIKSLIELFPFDEFYISEGMIREAIAQPGQFNIIHPASGMKVDVMIRKDTPFDRSRFQRIRRLSPSESYQADFAAPEDVIIKKMEYYHEGKSEKHLRDITGIMKISGDELDLGYISRWAGELGVQEIWEQIKKRLNT